MDDVGEIERGELTDRRQRPVAFDRAGGLVGAGFAGATRLGLVIGFALARRRG